MIGRRLAARRASRADRPYPELAERRWRAFSGSNTNGCHAFHSSTAPAVQCAIQPLCEARSEDGFPRSDVMRDQFADGVGFAGRRHIDELVMLLDRGALALPPRRLKSMP